MEGLRERQWLRQFRQAIDNSQPHLISHLHLHHLGRQALTNPMGILQLKFNLSATLLNKMKKQQVREVLQIIVTRVRTQVQDLGHKQAPA
jgi:hypothetical protein